MIITDSFEDVCPNLIKETRLFSVLVNCNKHAEIASLELLLKHAYKM